MPHILVDLCKGSLPWNKLNKDDFDEYNIVMRAAKLQTSIDELCRDCPQEFADLLAYAQDLDFKNWQRKFRALAAACGIKYDE